MLTFIFELSLHYFFHYFEPAFKIKQPMEGIFFLYLVIAANRTPILLKVLTEIITILQMLNGHILEQIVSDKK